MAKVELRGLVTGAPSAATFQRSRLAMGYAFSLGLSFLVGSTILKTINSNRWEDIAQMAAIIAVRTLINYLLLQAIGASEQIQECDKQLEGEQNDQMQPEQNTSRFKSAPGTPKSGVPGHK